MFQGTWVCAVKCTIDCAPIRINMFVVWPLCFVSHFSSSNLCCVIKSATFCNEGLQVLRLHLFCCLTHMAGLVLLKGFAGIQNLDLQQVLLTTFALKIFTQPSGVKMYHENLRCSEDQLYLSNVQKPSFKWTPLVMFSGFHQKFSKKGSFQRIRLIYLIFELNGSGLYRNIFSTFSSRGRIEQRSS